MHARDHLRPNEQRSPCLLPESAPKAQKPKSGDKPKSSAQDPKDDDEKPKSSVGGAKQKDPAKSAKDADQAKEDVIRSIDQILGQQSQGKPGTKKGRARRATVQSKTGVQIGLAPSGKLM